MSSPTQHPVGETGWVTLEDGIQFSHRWLTERTPRLHAAWQHARGDEQRRTIAARILRAAADAESETRPADAGGPAAGHEWVHVADRVDPRLTHGPDWSLLAAALSRAAATGYDVEARLPDLVAAAPLPDRHPARELHWRLIGDCPAALPDPPPARAVNPEPQPISEPPTTRAAADRPVPER